MSLTEKIGGAQVPPRSSNGGSTHAGNGREFARCIAYVDTMPPAISGSGGHNATIDVVRVCKGFALNESETLDILYRYNERCEPPWNERELRHKAAQLPLLRVPEGYILDQDRDWVSQRNWAREVMPEQKGNGHIAAAVDHRGDGRETIVADDVEDVNAPIEPPSGDPLYVDPNWGNLTDMGNAERLVAAHGDDLRYSHEVSKWLHWDTTRWDWDRSGAVNALAKGTVRAIYRIAAECPDHDRARAYAKHAYVSEGRSRVEAMVAMARSETGIPVRLEALDSDRMLLNLRNGTLDLRNGELRKHRKEDMITRCVDIRHDADAQCPLWLQFLWEVTRGKQDVIDFLQRAVGYSLTGETVEQVLFFLLGTGKNGKTTFGVTLQKLLGDYATQAAPDVLLQKRHDSHPTEQADLFGRRVAICSEIEENRKMAEVTVKQLTGSDRIKARRMREDFWEFEPTHKFWIMANHKPIIQGIDEAIWRRIMLILFDYVIPQERRDPRFAERLHSEMSGILNWSVTGCLDWQKSGLCPPESVLDATAAYRAESDSLRSFIDDMCERSTGLPEFRVGASLLLHAYVDYSGDRKLTRNSFAVRMEQLGYKRKRTNSGSVFCGIRLLASDDYENSK